MVRKKLTMKEFELMCEDELSGRKFLFKTENQQWDDVYNSLRFNLVFNKIFTCISPNRVCLVSDENNVTLIYVKYIYIVKHSYDENISFTVVCSGDTDDTDVEYIFWVL